MPSMNSLYVKVEHETKVNDVTKSDICDFMITHAMSILPLSHPQSVGDSMHPSAQVSYGIDVNLPLHKHLLEGPLTIIYNIPKPLSTTPPEDT